ncbi:MAG: hypothetical protein KDB00_11025, partial [Planctomycetales bacterium]|nr:hypothetical protein [Planctomycetales bacterium]
RTIQSSFAGVDFGRASASSVWPTSAQQKCASWSAIGEQPMIYVWKIRDDYAEKLIGTYDRSGPDRFSFKQGVECEVPSEKPRFQFDASISALESLNDLANNALVPLVSSRVAAVLQSVDGIQLIPAMVEGKDGSSDDYSIVVVTNKVRGLDHEQSSYKCVPGTSSIMRFEQAVYLDDCLEGKDVARDEEYLSNLLVSERLFGSLQEFNDLGLYPQDEVSWAA